MFIVIEGMDGCGKSTLIKNVQLLAKKEPWFKRIVTTREPGGSPIAEDVRKIIFKHKNLDKLTDFFLFTAARVEHIYKTIIPSLEKKKIVITDRFFYSSVVYQGSENKKLQTLILKVNQLLFEKYSNIEITRPNLLIFLTPKNFADAKKICSRKKVENRFDEESLAQTKAVWQNYNNCIDSINRNKKLKPKKILRLDPLLPPLELARVLIKEINSIIGV